MNFDRHKFFALVRDFLKSQGQQLTQKRTDALEFLIKEFENIKWAIPEISYSLATIYHETAHTFEPIYEYGPKSYFNKYEPGTRIGRNLGNTEKGDGYRYRGAGYVQITGRSNYRKFDIEHDPELALNPAVAFAILRRGMERGLFTGKKLSDFISDTGKDYKNARKIINGTDRAGLIAGYATTFEQILRDAKTSAAAQSATKPNGAQPIDHSDKVGEDNSVEQPPLNVNIDNAENVNLDNKPPPQSGPVSVKSETPSIWAKIGAGIAAITGLGIQFGSLVTTKLSEMTPVQLGYVIGGLAIIGIALWLYDRAAKRAHEKTLAKMETASDPAKNTVDLKG